MKLSQVSVVIPTYNRWQEIRNAINSICIQSYPVYEIIVVDDGSTEPSHEMGTRFELVKVVRHLTNLGAGAARNSGIRSASGEYIAFLDSDDIWLPQKLEKQVAFLESNLQVGACTTGYYYYSDGGWSVEIPKRRTDWHRHLTKGSGLCPGSTMVARREIIADLMYDEELPRLEDIDWLLRFTNKYLLDVIQEPLAKIYRGGRPSAKAVEISNLRIIEKHKESFLSYGRFYSNQAIGKRHLETAMYFFREGDRLKGWAYLKKAIHHNPIQHPGFYLRILDYLLGLSIVPSIRKIRQHIVWRGLGK